MSAELLAEVAAPEQPAGDAGLGHGNNGEAGAAEEGELSSGEQAGVAVALRLRSLKFDQVIEVDDNAEGPDESSGLDDQQAQEEQSAVQVKQEQVESPDKPLAQSPAPAAAAVDSASDGKAAAGTKPQAKAKPQRKVKDCLCCEDPAVAGHLYCSCHKSAVDVITRQLKSQTEEQKEWVKDIKKITSPTQRIAGFSSSCVSKRCAPL